MTVKINFYVNLIVKSIYFHIKLKGFILLKITLLISLLLFFTACSEEKPKQNYNAKKLIEQKCASCHNLDMPPTIYDDELAPPMMAISFHMKNFVTPTDESQRVPKAIEFVVDYVQNPALEKSYCDEESIKKYGLMPSQKENLSVGETKAIAEYMFTHFTQENLAKIQKAQAKFDALSAGEKLAIKHRCISCHKKDKKTVGPALTEIASKYKDNKLEMKSSITNGSSAKWKNSNGAKMPPFKSLSEEELETLSEWILKSNS